MKQEFPIFDTYKDLTYLDSAATSQKPQVVLDAITHYYTTQNANVHRGIYDLATKATNVYEQTRQAAANLLNAQKNEIVFTKSATESLNLLAHTLPIKKGATIILSELEHHANIVCWQQIAKQHNATIKWIPITNNYELDTNKAKELIKQGCDVLAITHQSNVTGAVTNLKELTQLAHQQDAVVIADGSQAIVHQDVDVKELAVDAYVFSGHKLYGPTGIGVLYATQALLDEMDVFLTGGEMIDTVTKEHTTFAHPPTKFEAGTPPIAQAAGLHAAIRWYQTRKNHAQQQELISYAKTQLQQIPNLTLYCAPQPSGCISFRLKDVDNYDLAAYLDTHNIAIRIGHHCTQVLHEVLQVDSTARVSIGLYNKKEDIDTFINALELAQSELA